MNKAAVNSVRQMGFFTFHAILDLQWMMFTIMQQTKAWWDGGCLGFVTMIY